MNNLNETASQHCRFLDNHFFTTLYHVFVEAFSDYVFRFALTEDQFRNHIIVNAVDLDRSVGAFDDERLVGFSLNGFGEWEGKPTVYDAGTGVVPDRRREGISDRMFDMMLPVFRESGIEQFLLEVVTTNTGAIKLYEKIGFEIGREVALLQCDGRAAPSNYAARNVIVKLLDEPNWDRLTSFWDGKPTWQNSVAAVERSRKAKRILGAFIDEICCGYIVFSGKFGRVAQLAVEKAHRRQGIGTTLVNSMHAEMAEGYSMQVINLDKSLKSATDFFCNRGFYERVSQHEMIKSIT